MMAVLSGLLCAPLYSQSFDFLKVQKWKGTIKVTGTGEGSSSSLGTAMSWKLSHGAQAEITLDKWDPLMGAWTGTVRGRGSVRDEYVIKGPQCDSVTTKIGEGDLANDQFGQPRQFYLTVDGNSYHLYPNDPYVATKNTSIICGQEFLSIEAAELWYPATRHAIGGTFPANGTTLQGTTTYTIPGADPSGDIRWEITWSFTPSDVEEVELVMEPQGYDNWIPEGTADELTPGNHLPIKATLRTKQGGTPKTPARKFTWTVQSSREPGVSMNYPLQAAGAKPAPDLAFTVEQNPELVVDIEGLRAEDERGGLTSSAVISAFDYGAWGQMRVTATLEDGRTVSGTYNNENSLRLPKRSASSFIADAWKQNTGASGSDSEDKDSEPEGDGFAGDGLTLYEEYRGFFENGRHMRTNPRKKDLFILDEMGGRAKPGIALFASVTGIEVHHELTAREMKQFPDDHVINANHAQGPHLVDQHGVVIVETDRVKEGALAWSSKYPDVVGTPKTVDLVGVSTTPGEGLGSGPLPYFDKIIAHELAHTVAIPHHGDKDYKISMNLKRTPSGRYVLRTRGDDVLYRLYDEQSDYEVSQTLGETIEAGFRGGPAEQMFVEEVESPSGLWIGDLIVGAPGGQHSGHEECLMRYEFAKAYELKDRADAYYLFSGQQRGSILCTDKKGTGANAPEHMPQSRHGDATQGSCASKIRVSDAGE